LDPVVLGSHGYRSVAAGYSASARTTFPVTISGTKSLVSTIGKAKVSGGAAESLKKAAVLTIVETVPAGGSFRPTYVAGDKPYFNTSQIQYSLLPSLPKPSAPLPSLTMMQYVWLDHGPKVNGAEIHPSDNMPPYPRDLAIQVSRMAQLVLLDIPERNDQLIKFLQLGIDNYYTCIKNGDAWRAYGGFGNGRKWPILFAGIIFNDDNMKNPPLYISQGSNIHKFGEDGHTYFGQPTTEYPDGKPLWGQLASQGWTNHDVRDPEGLTDCPTLDGYPCGGYRKCCTSHTWVGSMLASLIMGAKDLWNWPAHYAYVDRWVKEEDYANASSQYYKDIYGFGGEFIRVMWDTYRNNLPVRIGGSWQKAVGSWQPSPTLTVQPNPMTNYISFIWNDGVNKISKIRIFDNAGNLVGQYVGAYRNTPLQWYGNDIAGNPVKPGVYFYQITTGQDTFTGRIVKTR
jgi:hypothetical protein